MRMIILALLSIWVLQRATAQDTLQSSGPSFTPKDTNRAEAISVASLQVYPLGLERSGTEPIQSDSLDLITESTQARESTISTISAEQNQAEADSGPIRDWSNPPGYLGSSGSPARLTKHKPLKPKKYQRIKTYRCYTF